MISFAERSVSYRRCSLCSRFCFTNVHFDTWCDLKCSVSAVVWEDPPLTLNKTDYVKQKYPHAAYSAAVYSVDIFLAVGPHLALGCTAPVSGIRQAYRESAGPFVKGLLSFSQNFYIIIVTL
jgi:hypothetical protein